MQQPFETIENLLNYERNRQEEKNTTRKLMRSRENDKEMKNVLVKPFKW